MQELIFVRFCKTSFVCVTFPFLIVFNTDLVAHDIKGLFRLSVGHFEAHIAKFQAAFPLGKCH
jgi:hypothetical protein